MELARRLIEEARAHDERRLLVLSGSRPTTVERAGEVLEAVDVPPEETTYVGPGEPFHCECLGYDRTAELLGTTRTVVLLDCHGRCEPNAIGRLVGAVDGGGLFVLLTPPLSGWDERRDDFDERLAVPPFDVADVTGFFRRRFVGSLRQHRGVALVDAETGTIERDGLVSSEPRGRPDGSDGPAIPGTHRFPVEAYERCLTADQVDALATFESLLETPRAVVVEANRGRGKSAAAGLAAASLAAGGDDVLVTAPAYRNARTLLSHARTLLAGLGGGPADDSTTGLDAVPRRLDAGEGHIQYRRPVEAGDRAGEYDVTVVDEAAALPVHVLSRTLECDRVAYVTTTHGYEGAGRGFTVRFDDRLGESRHEVTRLQLATPIRYAPGDPVEVWSFRALALDARPPVADVVGDAEPETVTYRRLESRELLADEALLGEVFGLLVLAHYRTEPNDLARMLDAPNVSVHGLFHDGHPVTVALLAREGNLPAEQRASVYEGSRIRGNLVPDVLTSQLRDERAGETVGYRVMRIATHDAVRSRGLGSQLLADVREELPAVDWFGVGYGATPELVRFWGRNGYVPVHLSTTRNRRSGEHSAVMLDPRSPAGEELCERHVEWFLARLPGMLADSLDSVDPDVVRELCRATPAEPRLDLSGWDWRHVAAVAVGPGIFEMAPTPVRRLALRALVDQDGPLAPPQERLLVRRALQLRPREEVASELGYHSEATCMRALGGAVEALVETYGPEFATDELDRLR